MKGFPIAHIFHPSIPPMHAVVNNHNRNIDYWTVKRKFAEIVSTNDVNKIYSISNELRRVLSAITALNFYQGDVPSVMIRIQPENMSPFIIDISTGEHDDYIIQTLDVGTFAPFGEQCTCSALMNPLMILVKIIKLRWIHILSYDQMVSRKINNQTTRCANSIFYTTLFTNSAPNYT